MHKNTDTHQPWSSWKLVQVKSYKMTASKIGHAEKSLWVSSKPSHLDAVLHTKGNAVTTQSVWPRMHHSRAFVLPSSSFLPNSTNYCNIVQCKCRDTPVSFFFRQDIWFNSNCSSFSTNDYISGKVPTDPLGLTDGKCIFCGSCGVVEGKKCTGWKLQKAWNQLDSPQLKLQSLVGERPGRN